MQSHEFQQMIKNKDYVNMFQKQASWPAHFSFQADPVTKDEP